MLRKVNRVALLCGGAFFLLMLAVTFVGGPDTARLVLGGIFAAVGAVLVVVMSNWYLGLTVGRWWVPPLLLVVSWGVQGFYGVFIAEQGMFSFWGTNLVSGIYAIAQICFVGLFHPELRDLERRDRGL